MLDLRERAVSADCRDDIGAGSSLCETPTGGLAQPVERTRGWQASLVASSAKPSTKPMAGEGPAVAGHQEGVRYRNWRCVDDGCQFGVDRDGKMGLGLALREIKHAVADILTA
jgi:hypothetical protein